MIAWRQAKIEDAEGIAALSRYLLPDHPEEAAVFAERMALCPEGCHVLAGERGIMGYVISHPWRRRVIPPLNASLGTLPEQADCWYIHDLGLGEAARGAGAGSRIVGQLAEIARSFRISVLALVAVSGAAPYWERRGFRPLLTAASSPDLAQYGVDAAYMERVV